MKVVEDREYMWSSQERERGRKGIYLNVSKRGGDVRRRENERVWEREKDTTSAVVKGVFGVQHSLT